MLGVTSRVHSFCTKGWDCTWERIWTCSRTRGLWRDPSPFCIHPHKTFPVPIKTLHQFSAGRNKANNFGAVMVQKMIIRPGLGPLPEPMLWTHIHALGDVLHGPQFEKEPHVHHGQDQQAEGERMFIRFHPEDQNTNIAHGMFPHITLIQATKVVVFHLCRLFISTVPNTETWQ